MVRKLGIGIAIIFRLLLLFLLINLIASFQEPFLIISDNKYITTKMNLESLIILLGGIFIIYTSIKEIWHMISYEPTEIEKKKVSVKKAIFMIVFMNLVFSFDSILSAMALTENNWIIAIAIITGGILMIVAANKVAQFLQKNRMYEVFGFIYSIPCRYHACFRWGSSSKFENFRLCNQCNEQVDFLLHF